ncbi:MAG: Crp/Fnr family transcriptional regulator [Bryobacteraceae bacterium]
MPRTGLAEADIDDLPLYTPFAWDDADKREAVRSWDEVFGFRKRRELGRGTYLFREGLPAREVFLLVDGLILLTCTAPVTESECSFGLRFPGELVGGSALSLGIPYPVSALAMTPVQILRVSLAELERMERENPRISTFFRRMLSRDLYKAAGFIVQLKTSSPEERVVRFLHLLASAVGAKASSGQVEINVPLRDRQIAEILGFSPRQLKRVKQEMHAHGKLQISVGRRWIFRTTCGLS